MARSKLRDLLPASIVSDQSSGDVLQQLTVISLSGSTAPGGSGAASSDGSSSAMQGSLQEFTGELSGLTQQMTTLGAVQQTQISATQDNTQALTQNTTTKGGNGSSLEGTLGGIAWTVLGGGLSSLIGGLTSLFGGGSSSQPSTALPIYQLPNPINFEGGLTGSSAQVMPVSYSQTGQPRTEPTSSTSQVTVQVNAIDSQSFLDHSDEIANAVKAAILNSHSINDVISDL
jgi:hypothetical protein